MVENKEGLSALAEGMRDMSAALRHLLDGRPGPDPYDEQVEHDMIEERQRELAKDFNG